MGEDIAGRENLICKFGACFESKGFREDEGIITVEQDGSDFLETLLVSHHSVGNKVPVGGLGGE
jgi:hypothetical protein